MKTITKSARVSVAEVLEVLLVLVVVLVVVLVGVLVLLLTDNTAAWNQEPSILHIIGPPLSPWAKRKDGKVQV